MGSIPMRKIGKMRKQGRKIERERERKIQRVSANYNGIGIARVLWQ